MQMNFTWDIFLTCFSMSYELAGKCSIQTVDSKTAKNLKYHALFIPEIELKFPLRAIMILKRHLCNRAEIYYINTIIFFSVNQT